MKTKKKRKPADIIVIESNHVNLVCRVMLCETDNQGDFEGYKQELYSRSQNEPEAIELCRRHAEHHAKTMNLNCYDYTHTPRRHVHARLDN